MGKSPSGTESIKQMCGVGFGPAYLSLHTCILEVQAGLLKMLLLPNHPIEREWYVVRVASRQLSHVALAFEQFMPDKGQAEIRWEVERHWG